ncbi:hypothetical protein TUM17387_11980 [Shewanella carassii]|uniref:hypothetical protein n=1 Tax=Shewanella carassii TaxID=1987584 RepID=UPI001BF049CE|nr:hypothetical protein [Shewanella carassii]BCV65839.1 hypothetical protein TUM17387_11980 [Shewanella carassii]
MKHLKKVLLFRVGFCEKVSRQDKNFFEAFLAGQSVAKRRISRHKKMATQGAAIQGRTKLIRTKQSGAKNENPLR